MPIFRTPTGRVVRNARRRGLTVLTHRQWGARQRATYAWRRKNKPSKRPADTVVQHITVTLDHGPLTGHFKTDVQTVERIGQERFGTGISYNWIVDMTTGMVAVGQPLDAKGSHTVNQKLEEQPRYSYDQNYHARAIAVLGMPTTPLSAKAENAIVQLIAAMIEEGELTGDPDYIPHSLLAAKDCPSNPTRNRMAEIRKAALRAARR